MAASITEIKRGLNKGEFSSVEITQDYLARIARHNPALNCFISVTDEIALEQARAADAALAKGEVAPLTGVPLAHKDLFCTDGVKTTCASRILDNFIAPYDATVIENFKRDGAVMLGKTNMDEFAMGSSNENCRAAPRAVPRRRSRPAWPPERPAPIPAARFASPPPCAALPASSRPMDGSRVTA
jgi:aspartyl-tRNA(Asn)/glutamyl-tRNA(Gln) amidotransferase subunit A